MSLTRSSAAVLSFPSFAAVRLGKGERERERRILWATFGGILTCEGTGNGRKGDGKPFKKLGKWFQEDFSTDRKLSYYRGSAQIKFIRSVKFLSEITATLNEWKLEPA